MSDQLERLGLDGLRREPAAKLGDSLDEIDIGTAAHIRGRPRGVAMLQTKTRQRLQSGHDTMRIVLGQSGDRVIHPCGTVQPPPEPLFEDRVEGGLGLCRVQNPRARIHIGFDRVAADDGLAEGMDGGGGQLVKLCSRRR